MFVQLIKIQQITPHLSFLMTVEQNEENKKGLINKLILIFYSHRPKGIQILFTI